MLDLFVCNKCDHVDSIAVAYFGVLPQKPEEQLCTQCATGQWHDQFEHAPYNPATDLVVNRPTGVGLG